MELETAPPAKPSHNHTIGLIVTRATLLAYPELLPELVGELRAWSRDVLLRVIDFEDQADTALATMTGDRVAGIIAAVRPSDRAITRAAAGPVPLLLYNCHAAGPTIDSVSCDHAACGEHLATLLLNAGHRRFGIIGASPFALVGVERAGGAVAALRNGRALAIEEVRGDYSYASGAAALDELFARMKPRPSAIIAVNDAMAIGALDRARALLVRVPRDLSVVGIDGTGMARLPSYQLTTMRQPLEKLAKTAAHLLRLRIAAPERPVEVKLFHGELIEGGSARLIRPTRRATAGRTRRG